MVTFRDVSKGLCIQLEVSNSALQSSKRKHISLARSGEILTWLHFNKIERHEGAKSKRQRIRNLDLEVIGVEVEAK